jgi:hypothetical protein
MGDRLKFEFSEQPASSKSPEAPAVPRIAFVDAAVALDERCQRLSFILLHFHVSQRSAPLAPRSFVRSRGIGGAADDRGIDVFMWPRQQPS